ncbi:MAG: ribosome recycling factor [Candidatus Saccharibacteria bacterium]|nr:ribosome recycling factor [Candidatus Saccharibacteria bacterium]
MDTNQIIDKFKNDTKVAKEHFEAELKKLRTGRAHPSMLDGIMVQAYGTAMPLNQAATISTPEAQLIQVSPFDPNNLQVITEAIRNESSLGFNPTDDGRIIRVPVPALTEERRRDIAKQLGEKKEDCLVRVRQARHDALDSAKEAKNAKTMSEDDLGRLEKQVDELMNSIKNDLEALAKAKEAEIMTI